MRTHASKGNEWVNKSCDELKETGNDGNWNEGGNNNWNEGDQNWNEGNWNENQGFNESWKDKW